MSNKAHPQSSFQVECQNGHINTFDKYEVCNRSDTVVRGDGRKRLPIEELLLKCKTCGKEMSVEIDCGGYRYQ